MDTIIEPTIDYDFSKLYLGPPSTLAGGAYFTRIMYNTNKQLFIQSPKSLTKQGFIKSGKKVFSVNPPLLMLIGVKVFYSVK